jgi:hypothetical protein
MAEALRLRLEGQIGMILAALALALLCAPLLALKPGLVLAACLALVLVVAVLAHPPMAAYILLGTTPLLAGIERGQLLPVLRPSEAVLAVVGLAALLAYAAAPSMQRARVRIGAVDVAILALAVTGSVVPILWLLARGKSPTGDDVFFALQLWKYYAVFLVVRSTVTTEREVRACLWISLGAASLVGIVAVLDALRLFGVSDLLSQHYGLDEAVSGDDRGASTIGSPHAVADVMLMNLAIATAWILRVGSHRRLLGLLCVPLIFGLIATGQFSGWLGLILVFIVVGVLTRRLGNAVLALVPMVLVAGIALRPVIAARISGFATESGLPQSWEVRLENLKTFFWPELGRDYHWLLGVRPEARIEGPEAWRDWVWIESGHTWLLWVGGIPMLLAFFAFLWVTLRRVGRVARRRADAIGVAAIASFTGLTLLAVLTITDPHLTMRGSADLNFSLLALALTGTWAAGRFRPREIRTSVHLR